MSPRDYQRLVDLVEAAALDPLDADYSAIEQLQSQLHWPESATVDQILDWAKRGLPLRV